MRDETIEFDSYYEKGEGEQPLKVVAKRYPPEPDAGYMSARIDLCDVREPNALGGWDDITGLLSDDDEERITLEAGRLMDEARDRQPVAE